MTSKRKPMPEGAEEWSRENWPFDNLQAYAAIMRKRFDISYLHLRQIYKQLYAESERGSVIAHKNRITDVHAKGISIEQLRKEYDWITKIEDCMRDRTDFLRDIDVRAEIGCPNAKWPEVKNRLELRKYQVRFKVNSKLSIYWSSPQVIAQAKRDIEGAI